jgi:hypothetical protein
MNKPDNLTVLVNFFTALLLYINIIESNILPFILLHFLIVCAHLAQEILGRRAS